MDVLSQRYLDEAASLWPPATAHFEEASLGMLAMSQLGHDDRLGDVTFSNEASVVARQKGLRDLAETVTRWGQRGAYYDSSDLQAKAAAEYSKLPLVESMRHVAERAAAADARFQRFVSKFPADRPAPLPPAA